VVSQASRGREAAGVAVPVARAFQPEICPSAFGPFGDRRKGAGAFAGSLSHAKPRSREAAKLAVQGRLLSAAFRRELFRLVPAIFRARAGARARN